MEPRLSPPLFTFYCSSIKGLKRLCYWAIVLNLHSTVVLLKDDCSNVYRPVLNNLHSTVVLLKVDYHSHYTTSNSYLHSTVVLLKGATGPAREREKQIYILL